MPFICSICGEESTRICARCTKDACDNHICEKCLRCSDCCECESPLCLDEEPAVVESVPPLDEIGVPVEEPTVEPAAMEPPPLPELVEVEPTAPDPESPEEHFPGTSPNGSW